MAKRQRRAGTTETFSVSVDAETKEALRALADSEFVAAATDCLLIGLPDGDVTAVDSLLDTACAAVTAETGMQFDLKAELHSEEAAARLLESY